MHPPDLFSDKATNLGQTNADFAPQLSAKIFASLFLHSFFLKRKMSFPLQPPLLRIQVHINVFTICGFVVVELLNFAVSSRKFVPFYVWVN